MTMLKCPGFDSGLKLARRLISRSSMPVRDFSLWVFSHKTSRIFHLPI
uniref:Uncharacterized protein n=1 Tax=Anguilla anguilla TaxID=7936 RepID=A0A0E9Q6X8_ANGAN